MRFFFWISGLLVTAAGLAVIVRSSLGNVVFFWPPYRVDLSLSFFLLLSLLFFILLFLIVKAVSVACKLPSEITDHRNRKRENESNKALKKSLEAFFEGQFMQSGQTAEKAMEWEPNRACSAMIAANAFHALRLYGQRDRFLKIAQSDPVFGIACRVIRTQWLIDDDRPLDALEEISRLNAEGIQHLHLKKLSLEANRLAGNWNGVVELVHLLEQRQALPETVARQLEKQAYRNVLLKSAEDIETIMTVWKVIPADWQRQPSIAVHAARAFYRAGLLEESRDILTRALDENWDAGLMRVYAGFASAKETADLENRIGCCLRWEKNYSVYLQWWISLGELYYKQNNFDLARFYLETAIEKQPESSLLQKAHFLLAQLYEKNGQPEQAACHYKKSSLAIQAEADRIAGQQE